MYSDVQRSDAIENSLRNAENKEKENGYIVLADPGLLRRKYWKTRLDIDD